MSESAVTENVEKVFDLSDQVKFKRRWAKRTDVQAIVLKANRGESLTEFERGFLADFVQEGVDEKDQLTISANEVVINFTK